MSEPTDQTGRDIARHDPARVPRAALVTGAAHRLGREIALGLAGAGWDVAVHFHRSAEEAARTASQVRALGRRAALVRADLADDAQVRAMFAAARESLGELGAIVNSASRFAHDSPSSFEPAALVDHVRPNLAAPLLLARLLHESLPADGSGVVVNLLDQKIENLNPDYFSYTLTKAALQAATRMLAMAFAPKLRVVGVSPGITLPSGDQSPADFDRAHRMTPLGRSSTPEDVVQTVLFALDSRAITGTTLVVDGGQHLLALARDVMYLTRERDAARTNGDRA
jgi:NAD(P)-dependent dehydrogenase (short-subunit alcohol dehydrogenase family)